MTMIIEWPTERPYVATVTGVHDGDTIYCDIDMGLRVHLIYKVRLLGCNASELSTEPGKAARDHLVEVLPAGIVVALLMVKDYKYGGEFVARPVLSGQRDLVAELIAGQWAAEWDGRGAAPQPPWPRTVDTPPAAATTNG